jgi:hypothetical protein
MGNVILGPIRKIEDYRDLFDQDNLDILVRDNLQDYYRMRLEDGIEDDPFDDVLLEVIRHYSTEPEFEQFLQEIEDGQ